MIHVLLRLENSAVLLAKPSSGGSGGTVAPAPVQRRHGDGTHEGTPDNPEALAAARGDGDIDRATAEMSAIIRYTGSAYRAIRKSQAEGKDSSDAKNIESFLKDGVPFKGEIYRGVALKSFADFEKRYGSTIGSEFTEKAMNSWSSERKVAKIFSTNSSAARPVAVVFTVQNKTGVSIQKISSFGSSEAEVLVGKNARYRIKAVSTKLTLENVPANGGTIRVTLEQI